MGTRSLIRGHCDYIRVIYNFYGGNYPPETALGLMTRFIGRGLMTGLVNKLIRYVEQHMIEMTGLRYLNHQTNPTNQAARLRRFRMQQIKLLHGLDSGSKP